MLSEEINFIEAINNDLSELESHRRMTSSKRQIYKQKIKSLEEDK